MQAALCLLVLGSGFSANASYDRTRRLECRNAIYSVQHWAYEVRRSEIAIRNSDRICGYSQRCRNSQMRTYEYTMAELRAAEFRRSEYCF